MAGMTLHSNIHSYHAHNLQISKCRLLWTRPMDSTIRDNIELTIRAYGFVLYFVHLSLLRTVTLYIMSFWKLGRSRIVVLISFSTVTINIVTLTSHNYIKFKGISNTPVTDQCCCPLSSLGYTPGSLYPCKDSHLIYS